MESVAEEPYGQGQEIDDGEEEEVERVISATFNIQLSSDDLKNIAKGKAFSNLFGETYAKEIARDLFDVLGRRSFPESTKSQPGLYFTG